MLAPKRQSQGLGSVGLLFLLQLHVSPSLKKKKERKKKKNAGAKDSYYILNTCLNNLRVAYNSRENVRFWFTQTCVQLPALPSTACVPLGKLLNIVQPRFVICKMQTPRTWKVCVVTTNNNVCHGPRALGKQYVTAVFVEHSGHQPQFDI